MMRRSHVESEPAMTGRPENSPPNTPPISRKKLVIFGICLALVSVFMYVSIIIKTATIGP
jgi:hypothetical protein